MDMGGRGGGEKLGGGGREPKSGYIMKKNLLSVKGKKKVHCSH